MKISTRVFKALTFFFFLFEHNTYVYNLITSSLCGSTVGGEDGATILPPIREPLGGNGGGGSCIWTVAGGGTFNNDISLLILRGGSGGGGKFMADGDPRMQNILFFRQNCGLRRTDLVLRRPGRKPFLFKIISFP